MKKLLIGLALLIAVGAAAGGWWWWSKGRTTSMVEERVRHALNDPTSAEFKLVEFNTRHGTGCGFVNARNRMGGMVGFTAFIAYPDGEVRFQPVLRDPGRMGWLDQALIYCDAGGEDTPFWQALMAIPN